MKFREVGALIIVIIVVASAAIGYISSKWLGDDNPIEEFCQDIIEDQTGFEIDITPSFHYVKPWETNPDSKSVRKFLEVYGRYLKKDPIIKGASLSCDMAIYGEQGKMPVVIIGPRGGNIHSSDEWVLLEDIYSLTGLFALMIKEWCGR